MGLTHFAMSICNNHAQYYILPCLFVTIMHNITEEMIFSFFRHFLFNVIKSKISIAALVVIIVRSTFPTLLHVNNLFPIGKLNNTILWYTLKSQNYLVVKKKNYHPLIISQKNKKVIELFCILFRDTFLLYYLFNEIFLLTLFDNVINFNNIQYKRIKEKKISTSKLKPYEKNKPK